MPLDKEIKKKVEAKFGRDLKYSVDCKDLSDEIEKATKQRLSRSTLERLFGMVAKDVVPHRSTLDILAEYIGYPSYQHLADELNLPTIISDFESVEQLVAEDLEEGTQIEIRYEPDRLILMSYLGGSLFLINEIHGSKNLKKGDKLRITNFVLGYELLIADVERNGEHLGQYKAAKIGGLTSIEIFN